MRVSSWGDSSETPFDDGSAGKAWMGGDLHPSRAENLMTEIFDELVDDAPCGAHRFAVLDLKPLCAVGVSEEQSVSNQQKSRVSSRCVSQADAGSRPTSTFILSGEKFLLAVGREFRVVSSPAATVPTGVMRPSHFHPPNG